MQFKSLPIVHKNSYITKNSQNLISSCITTYRLYNVIATSIPMPFTRKSVKLSAILSASSIHKPRGTTYTIPPKSNTVTLWKCDFHVYKERHLVECFFNKLKQFRRDATRYDKLAASFTAFVCIAAN